MAPVVVPADPLRSERDVDVTPNQYVPTEWEDYFYKVLTPALRERFAIQELAAPPPAVHYLDDTDSMLDLSMPVAQRQWNNNAAHYRPVEPVYFVDTNGNRRWDQPSESAWIETSDDGYQAISGTLPTADDYLEYYRPPLSAIYFDANHDGKAQASEVVRIDQSAAHGVEIDGVTGDLLGYDMWGNSRAVWKDVNPNGVYDSQDQVVFDGSGVLAANATTGAIWGQRDGVEFADVNGNGKWDDGGGAPPEPIWLDGTYGVDFAPSPDLPPYGGSIRYKPWWNTYGAPAFDLFGYASDPAGWQDDPYPGLEAYTDNYYRNPAPFRIDLWSFYQGVEYLAPFFARSSAGGPTRWDMPAFLDAVSGQGETIEGTVTRSLNPFGGYWTTWSGTHFTRDVKVGDWLSPFGQVASIESDTDVTFTDKPYFIDNAPIGTSSLSVHSWTRVAPYQGDGLSLSNVRGMFLPNSLLSRRNFVELYTALSMLIAEPSDGEDPGPPLDFTPLADLPVGDLVPTTELDYRNVIPDTDRDGIIEVDQDLDTFGNDTGSIAFQADRNGPQVYLPLGTSSWGSLPFHAYLSQGGFAAGDGRPLTSHDLDDSPGADLAGTALAYSLDTRVRTNLLLNDGVNHVKRMEVVRPRGNAVVFDFKWDAANHRFEDTGLPIGWDPTDPTHGRDADRLYVLHAAKDGYDLLFPSGVIQHFGAYTGDRYGVEAGLRSVSRSDLDYNSDLKVGSSLYEYFPSLNAYNNSATTDKYDITFGWQGGRLDSVKYTDHEADSKSIVTKLGYAPDQSGVPPTVNSLQKTGMDGTTAQPIPEFSYAYDASQNKIVNGPTTWTRTGSINNSGGDVTITRMTQGTSGSYAVHTLFNAAGLMTQTGLTFNNGIDAAKTDTTVYAYVAEPGTYTNRYANGVPKWGKVKSVTDSNGGWQRFTYDDPDGWLTKTVSPFHATPFTETDESKLRVEEFGYSEADGRPAEAAYAARRWYWTERPRTDITRVLGVEVSNLFLKYTADSTITRPGTSSQSTWATAAALQTRRRLTGFSPFGPSYETSTPTSYVDEKIGGYHQIITTRNRIDPFFYDPTIDDQETKRFNAFGTLIDLETNESRRDPFSDYTTTLTGKYTSTPSPFGFGRIQALHNELSNYETTYGDDQTWFGPRTVTGEDGAVTTIDYTPWGAVSNRTTFNIASVFTYDAAGNVTGETDTGQFNDQAAKSVNSAARFDVYGRVVFTQDTSGRQTTTDYATGGGTISATVHLPGGATNVASQYVDGSMAQTYGQATYPTTYDSGVDPTKGYWVKSATNDGKNWEKTYFDMLGNAHVVERSGPNGDGKVMTSTTEYDAFGRPAKTTDFDGTVTLTEYDDVRGNVSDVILDMNGNGTYDPGIDRNTSTSLALEQLADGSGGSLRGYFKQTTTVHGGSSPYTPDSVSVLETSFDGLKTIATAAGLKRTTEFAYTGGQGASKTTVTNADGTRTENEYDQGRLKKIADYGTHDATVATDFMEYTYDALGRGTSSATSFGASALKTTWSIGSTDEVDSVTLPGGRTYSVQSRSALDGSPTAIQRPDTKVFNQTFNAQGQLSSVSGAGVFAQRYDYKPVTGDVASMTTYTSGQLNGNGAATTSWSINDFTGQNTGKTYAGEINSVGNTYKDNGLLDQNTVGSNAATSTQNLVGEDDTWTTADLSQGVVVRDAKGRILQTSQTSVLGGTSVSVSPVVAYDANDNLASESVGNVPDTSVQYGYYAATDTSDAASPGAPQSVNVVRDGQTLSGETYTYDPATKRTKTVTAGGKDFSYDYYPGTDLVETLNSVNGTVTTTRGYEPDTGRLASLTQRAGTTVLYSATYHYNDNDQRDRADVTYVTPDGQTHQVYWSYEYDEGNADQLQSAMAYSDSGRTVPITDRQFTYAFDGIGNRTDKNYLANAANQYQVNPTANGGEGQSMLYNDRGDLTDDGEFTYTYDSADRLTSATPLTPDHAYKTEFGYDDQGRRIWKKSSVKQSTSGEWELREYRKFVYDGDTLVAEFVQDPKTGLDMLSRTYAWGQDIGGGIGGLLSITTYQADGVTPDKTYLPLYDGGGNVTGLVDAATGAVVASYEYDPFGNTLSATGDQAAIDANPFRFSTKYFDSESGLYYYGMRYYSPDLGRWLTRDPMQEAGGVNVYAFVNNDPINNADLTGLAGVSLTITPQPTDTPYLDPTAFSLDLDPYERLLTQLGTTPFRTTYTHFEYQSSAAKLALVLGANIAQLQDRLTLVTKWIGDHQVAIARMTDEGQTAYESWTGALDDRRQRLKVNQEERQALLQNLQATEQAFTDLGLDDVSIDPMMYVYGAGAFGSIPGGRGLKDAVSAARGLLLNQSGPGVTSTGDEAFFVPVGLMTKMITAESSIAIAAAAGRTARAAGGASVLRESVSHAFGHGASIRSINPGRYMTNCPECSIYVDDLLAGQGLHVASHSGMLELLEYESVLSRRFGRAMEFSELGSLSTIEAEMAEAGAGARGIVFAHKGDLSNGHYFNVVNQNGIVRFLDGQSGTAARVEKFLEFSYVRTN